MIRNFLLLALFLLILCRWEGLALATEQVTVSGKIFLRNTPRTNPAYLFKKTTSENGDRRNVRSEYRKATGELLVEESYQYKKGKLVRYVYNQLQMREGGAINIGDGKVHYEFAQTGQAKKSEEEDEPDDLIVADLISPFIKRHWASLIDGDTVHTRYLVLERQESFGFKFFTDEERPCGKESCVLIIMKPSSIFMAALVDPIRILVNKSAPHQIREIDGRLPIRIPEVNKPKSRRDYRALDAVLVLE